MSPRSFLVRLGLLLLCAPFITACATDIKTYEMPVSKDFRLGTGDRMKIDVFREPDLSLETTLESSGTINYPLLGRIQVVGLTPHEIEQSLTERLSQGYLLNPSIRVSIIQFRPIYITGQVNRVGAFPFTEALTVGKAIALAGGITNIGSERKIYVIRELHSPNEREKASLDTPLFPGDTVVVEESLF